MKYFLRTLLLTGNSTLIYLVYEGPSTHFYITRYRSGPSLTASFHAADPHKYAHWYFRL